MQNEFVRKSIFEKILFLDRMILELGYIRILIEK